MTPSVTVIIPTWNRAGTVGAAVKSALTQSIQVLEVLVCDDGSTDDTEAVVGSLSELDPRVRWVSGARAGRPAIPRNRGMRESRGDWIAFLDSDDEWLPNKLEVQFRAASDRKCMAVCANAYRVLDDGRVAGTLHDWNGSRLTIGNLLASNLVVCSSSIVHRSVLARTGGFPESTEFRAIEDYALWLRVSSLTRFAYCPEALVSYRDNPMASLRAQQGLSPRQQRQIVLDDLWRWLKSQGFWHLGLLPAIWSTARSRWQQKREMPN